MGAICSVLLTSVNGFGINYDCNNWKFIFIVPSLHASGQRPSLLLETALIS